MKKQKINRPLILDGAMGSILQEKNLLPISEFGAQKLIDDSRSEVLTLHKDYIRAGADIITTNTFRTNPYSLISSGVTDIVGSVSKKLLRLLNELDGNSTCTDCRFKSSC
ncbi:MAG: homocysteine S-methyltransferase family protein [Ignavibacteriales bacterium]|nr:homocysteine S-methyltransferase family protein [Ignavibacteriales bacterium]